MASDGLPVPERATEEWDPFMEGLFRRVRRERRMRLTTRFAAAACLVVALWAGLSMGTARRTEPLRAEVPTTEAPLFQPDASEGGAEPIVLVCSR